MTILPHSEKGHVKDRLTVGGERGNSSQLCFGFRRRDLDRILASHTMDLRFGDVERRKQETASQAEVAFGIVGGNAAFVTPKELDGTQRPLA